MLCVGGRQLLGESAGRQSRMMSVSENNILKVVMIVRRQKLVDVQF